MGKAPNDKFDEGLRIRAASRALLTAAIGGLLYVGAQSCSSKDDTGGDKKSALDGGDAATEAPEEAIDAAIEPEAEPDVAVDVVATSDANADADASIAPDVADTDAYDAPPVYEAAAQCDSMPEAGAITSSKVDPTMTEAKFKAECDALGGAFEVEPHCGGSNACKGMSFDSATSVLTEHTCKGMNTCAGFSCVICGA